MSFLGRQVQPTDGFGFVFLDAISVQKTHANPEVLSSFFPVDFAKFLLVLQSNGFSSFTDCMNSLNHAF